jgi:hypothetical protein
MRKSAAQNTRVYFLAARNEEVNMAEQTGEGGCGSNVWSGVYLGEGMKVL